MLYATLELQMHVLESPLQLQMHVLESPLYLCSRIGCQQDTYPNQHGHNLHCQQLQEGPTTDNHPRDAQFHQS